MVTYRKGVNREEERIKDRVLKDQGPKEPQQEWERQGGLTE